MKDVNEFIAAFDEEYTALAEAAEKQVVHTATEGWRSLVKMIRDADRKDCQALAEELHKAAKLIDERGPNEGVIKSIADLKKRADEVYETAQHMELSVITPIRLAAIQCQQLIATKLADAEKLDNTMPLVWGGLRRAMMDHINGLTHYAWSDEEWTVNRSQMSPDEQDE